jgi:hypothetical protein
MHEYESNARLIARVIRDEMRVQSFTSIADLKVAVKLKLRALKIPYEPADLDAAFTVVASNRPLVED